MRVWVYIPDPQPAPTPSNRPKAYTDAQRTEVDVESIDGLLEKLLLEAPEGTRVVAFDNGTTHYILGSRGFEKKLRVVA